jgi:acetyl-CoA decarbonylase/synthase complex subunit gamma
MDEPWTDGIVQTALGDVPRARTDITWQDRLGTLRVRSGIGRMNYRVPPGLYAVGNPAADSTVLVSANYKLSFDRLRGVLAGRDAWILVLDTHGINVWCAAGKGTFSSAEIARRVVASGLARIVSHRRLVVPQLAATGVSAHEVRRSCGFSVVYGPVRAEDLPAFLDARMKATPAMRQVRFRLRDRAVLIPVEVVGGARLALPLAMVLLLLGGVGSDGYSSAGLRTIGTTSATLLLGAFLAGTIAGPILLPWLPGRPFALKGALLGVALAAGLISWHLSAGGVFASAFHAAAWALLLPTVISFVVMTFTGSSTFTSLSGVLREMRFAVPLQIAGGVAGVALWLAGLFLGRAV